MADNTENNVDSDDTANDVADERVSSSVNEGGEKSTDWESKYREMQEHSRLWEKRAKDNKAAAEKLAEIEDRDKSEAERMSERLDELTRERDTAVMASVRASVALEYGLGKDDAELFLTASDEDTMRRQAEELSKRVVRKSPEDRNQGVSGDRSTKESASQWFESLIKK